jgi:hypothetical protein
MRQAGYPVPAQPTPRALAHILEEVHTTRASSGAADPVAHQIAAVRAWCLRMEASRYGPSTAPMASPNGTAQPSRSAVARLRREFKQLDWPPNPAPQ